MSVSVTPERVVVGNMDSVVCYVIIKMRLRYTNDVEIMKTAKLRVQLVQAPLFQQAASIQVTYINIVGDSWPGARVWMYVSTDN